MKKIGCALLITGFFWLSFGVMTQEPRVRGVLIETYNKLPQKDTFNKKEVKDLILKACYDTSKAQPTILAPSLIMLLGSIMLSWNKKNNNGNK